MAVTRACSSPHRPVLQQHVVHKHLSSGMPLPPRCPLSRSGAAKARVAPSRSRALAPDNSEGEAQSPLPADVARLSRLAQALSSHAFDSLLLDEEEMETEESQGGDDAGSWDDGAMLVEHGAEPGDLSVLDPDAPAPSTAPVYKSRRAARRRASEAREAALGAGSRSGAALPRVAIVGRPNVGKSALFNRLAGSDLAIVHDAPGVTRDRLYCPANWGGRDFLLADTGGLMADAAALLAPEHLAAAARSISAPGLPAAIERQAAAAVAEAAAVVLCVDGQEGPTAGDEEIVAWLRRTFNRLPVLLAVNKCEAPGSGDLQAAQFWGLGLEPIPVSAISGTGTGDLLDALVRRLREGEDEDEDEEAGEAAAAVGGAAASAAPGTPAAPVAVAIIGRPNVGKSSILNALIGQDRSIVSDMAGTTRDAVDTEFTAPDGTRYTLIDTAGVRRRTAVAASPDGAETLSVNRALRAVRRADVAVLVLDATEGIAQQDFRLAEYVAAEGRACVIVVNKWDAVAGKGAASLAEFETNVRAELRPVEWANMVFCSATTGLRIPRILDAVRAACAEHRRRVPTATLNMVVRDAVAWRAPPALSKNKQARVYYATQTAVAPPTFVLFTNVNEKFPEDYKRYIQRQLREHIGFPGSPLRVYWRGKTPRGEEGPRKGRK
ncbi:TGD3 [Auxenochlorella protothecoides x Auxenochlorella symbiontica]